MRINDDDDDDDNCGVGHVGTLYNSFGLLKTLLCLLIRSVVLIILLSSLYFLFSSRQVSGAETYSRCCFHSLNLYYNQLECMSGVLKCINMLDFTQRKFPAICLNR